MTTPATRAVHDTNATAGPATVPARPARKRRVAAVCIGLGIPLVALVGVMPILAPVHATVLGVPLLFFWIFLCFPLTTACLMAAWHLGGGSGSDDDAHGSGGAA